MKVQVHVDSVLPFGLYSAHNIFNTMTDALQWVMLSKGIRFIFHYLGDFVTVSTGKQDNPCNVQATRVSGGSYKM